MKQLTKLQSDVFNYLITFYEENNQLPPVQSIADTFDKWPNQIQEMLFRFEVIGLIEKNAVGKFRFSRNKE